MPIISKPNWRCARCFQQSFVGEDGGGLGGGALSSFVLLLSGAALFDTRSSWFAARPCLLVCFSFKFRLGCHHTHPPPTSLTPSSIPPSFALHLLTPFPHPCCRCLSPSPSQRRNTATRRRQRATCSWCLKLIPTTSRRGASMHRSFSSAAATARASSISQL